MGQPMNWNTIYICLHGLVWQSDMGLEVFNTMVWVNPKLPKRDKVLMLANGIGHIGSFKGGQLHRRETAVSEKFANMTAKKILSTMGVHPHIYEEFYSGGLSATQRET